jgi:hypothetical protein
MLCCAKFKLARAGSAKLQSHIITLDASYSSYAQGGDGMPVCTQDMYQPGLKRAKHPQHLKVQMSV